MSNNSKIITLQQAKESRPDLCSQAKTKINSTTQDEQLDLFRRICSLAKQIISQATYDVETQDKFDAMQEEILLVAAALARAQARARCVQQIQLSCARRSSPQPLRAQYAQIEAVPSEYFADVDGNETEDELILEVEGVIL